MRQGLGIYYYFLFETKAPDGSAFYGIYRSENPSWGSDGTPIKYIGTGKKLANKARQYGIHRLITTVLFTDALLENVQKRLDSILTPATLADPRCLNEPQIPRAEKISASLTDVPKSEEHRLHIAEAMVGNDNALGHVKSEETKEIISEAKSKMKWWHKKETGEEIQLLIDEEGLTGFELGRLPKEFAKNFKKRDPKPMSDAERARVIRD